MRESIRLSADWWMTMKTVALTFEIRKGRFSFKLNAPYSAERREGGQRAGKEEYPEFAARQEVTARRQWGECFPAAVFSVLMLMLL